MGSLLLGLLIGWAVIVMRHAPSLPTWADMLVSTCALVVMGWAFIASYRRPTTQEGPKP